MYFYTSNANFPGLFKPYASASSMNLLFFIPYTLFAVFMIIPLPVAFVFQAFKDNRSQVLLKDRLIEKEALFLAFICIDFQRRGYISLMQWEEFVSAVYSGTHDKKKVRVLFEMIDERNIGYMVSYSLKFSF